MEEFEISFCSELETSPQWLKLKVKETILLNGSNAVCPAICEDQYAYCFWKYATGKQTM